MLRIQLYEPVLGTYPTTEDIKDGFADPIGINEVTQTIKRSKDNEGITFEIVLDAVFIKRYRDFVLRSFGTRGGIDMNVVANIYRYTPNTGIWTLYGENKLNPGAKFEIEEDRVTTNIDNAGFQVALLNLIERSIDLETTTSENGSPLPPQPTHNVTYHSKTILKSMEALPHGPEEADVEIAGENIFSFELPGLSDHDRERMVYGTVATQFLKVDELEETFQQPFGWSDYGFGMGTGDTPSTPSEQIDWLDSSDDVREKFFPFYRAKEQGTLEEVRIKLNLQHKVVAINGSGDIDVGPCDEPLANVEIMYFLQVRDADGNIINTYFIGEWDMSHGCASEVTGGMETHELVLTNVPVGIGYEFAVFSTWRVFGHYRNTDVGSDTVDHNFYVTPGPGVSIIVRNATTAAPTQSKTIMIYEAVKRCVQYISNELDCFRSDLLGRTDLGYAVDGELSLIGITTGNNLRGRPKPVFSSLQDLLDFINAIGCIGFGFERLPNGKIIMRLEKKEYFYRKNTSMISLGKVYKVKRVLDTRRLYNKVDYGPETKVDVGQVNAVDEFNSKRSSALSVFNTKNALKITYKQITAGYMIEAQRRLSTSTQDGKNDDANFMVSMVRTGSTFKPKTMEGYNLVENVLYPDTVYNLDFQPERTLRNWYPTLATSLVYALRKELTFLSGEVNYLVRTRKVGETFIVDGQVPVDMSVIEPLTTGFKLQVEDVKTRFEQFMNMKSIMYGTVDFEDNFGGSFLGFISDTGIEHDENKGVADYDLFEVYRPTV